MLDSPLPARYTSGMSIHMVQCMPVDQTCHEDLVAMVALAAKVWPDEIDDIQAQAERIAASTRTEPDWRNWIVRDGGQIIAKAHTFARTIADEQGEMTILALAGVCSDPHRRGEGLGRSLVENALDLVDNGDYPACLFQTSLIVQPFYEKLGAIQIPNPVVNSKNTEYPEANPFWDDVVMWYPPSGRLPAGTIDLQGPGY